MSFFDLFKRKQKYQKLEKVETKEKYWSLTTNEDTIIEPSWKQIQRAVEGATSDNSIFATLSYNDANIEIEAIQVIGAEDRYRVEVLPSETSDDYGKIYVKDGLAYNETLKLFEEFYNRQIVSNYENWTKEK
ncbi:MAG TPA: hypothetical protein VK078_03525 [Pseudogracilibacillus sp.]|nr:hypothetical protein [Pseudogracilibacillus sp.]